MDHAPAGSIPPNLGELCFGNQARLTARALTRAFNARLRPLNLQATQFALLATVNAGRADSIAAMAEELNIEASALLRNLQMLETRGLVTSEGGRGPLGRRLRLTGDGEAMLAAAYPVWSALQAELADAMGEHAASVRESLRRLGAAAAAVSGDDR